MSTWSDEDAHGAFETVQRKVFPPGLKPDTADFGSASFTNKPDPDTTVHLPVPLNGLVAFKVAPVPHTV